MCGEENLGNCARPSRVSDGKGRTSFLLASHWPGLVTWPHHMEGGPGNASTQILWGVVLSFPQDPILFNVIFLSLKSHLKDSSHVLFCGGEDLDQPLNCVTEVHRVNVCLLLQTLFMEGLQPDLCSLETFP